MNKNESLKQSYFMVTNEVALVYLSIFRNATNMANLHYVFNRNFSQINELCDENDNIIDMSKRDLDIKNFKVIQLGASRD
jgi:hypothetical protein